MKLLAPALGALYLVPLSLAASIGIGCDDSSPSAADTSAADTSAPDTAADTSGPSGDSASPTPDTGAGTPDVAPDTGSELPAGCDRSGFVAALQGFESSNGAAILEMRSGEGEPVDVLQIELYTSGDYRGATEAGTYSLDGSTYQDCSNCVVLRTGCEGGSCAKRFLVDEGDLVISQWDQAGGHFAGHLANARAHEVTIDPDTYVSTLVPGGETWCLDGVTFDAEVPTLPVSDRTQPTCVNDGTGTLVGDNIANFQLKDCLGRRVKLHGTCNDADARALWLIGTTGWCTACHEFLSEFVADHGGSLSRKIVGEQTKGLDMLIILGEDGYGQKPTEAYCKAYAEDLGIDPGMVLIDWSDEAVPLEVINAPGVMVETNSLGTLWTHINPYLMNEGGSVVTTYPWWALLRPRNMEYVWSDRAQLQGFEATLFGLLAED